MCRFSVVAATRAWVFDQALRVLNLVVGSGAQLVHSVSSVKCLSDLFVLLDKNLKFIGQVSVLVRKSCAVQLESIDFGCQVPVVALESLVRKLKLILFSARHSQVFICWANPSLDVVKRCCEVFVPSAFVVKTSWEFIFFWELDVKGFGLARLVAVLFDVIFSRTMEINLGCTKRLARSFQVKISHFSHFLYLAKLFL